MNGNQKNRKAKAGLLLLASSRFKNLGEGLSRGTYNERKAKAVKEIIGTMDFLDITYPGIIYEREDAEKAISMFFNEKVDFIIAEFLSWSEDYSWIRFLRDMPPMPEAETMFVISLMTLVLVMVSIRVLGFTRSVPPTAFSL